MKTRTIAQCMPLKDQYKMYGLARNEIRTNIKDYCCNALHDAYSILTNDFSINKHDLIPNYFPDFYACAPERITGTGERITGIPWWEDDDAKTRVHVLHLCRVIIHRRFQLHMYRFLRKHNGTTKFSNK